MRRLAAVIVVAACTEPIEYPGPPELVIGIGQDELVPIEDGDVVPISTGPQGGTIVWGAVAARYLDPIGLELVFAITPPDGEPSLRRVVTDLADAEDGLEMGTSTGLHVFLPDEDQFAGLPCRWRVEARDRAGRTVLDEKTIVPTRDESALR